MDGITFTTVGLRIVAWAGSEGNKTPFARMGNEELFGGLVACRACGSPFPCGLLLVSLAFGASLVAGFTVGPQLMGLMGSKPRDFGLASRTSQISVRQGSSSNAIISLPSLNGFTGSLGVTETPTGNCVVTVLTTDGSVNHSLTMTVSVFSAPDFTIAAAPASVTVRRNYGYNSTTISLASVDGFAGSVSLSVNTPFSFIAVAGGASPLAVAVGGSNSTILGISATSLTPLGNYRVNVTGVSGGFSHTVTVVVLVLQAQGCGCCTCGIEALNMENYSFNSRTNATLSLRNTGSSSISLASYYVKDASGDTYSRTSWTGPTIAPNSVGFADILIGSSCGTSCTLVGTAFTFTAGSAYTITAVTSRNNQFTFTIIGSSCGTCGREALNVDAYSFSSATNATLYIRNTGSLNITLVSYYVRDASNDTYARVAWSGPTIVTNTTKPASFLIGSSCNSCTFDWVRVHVYAGLLLHDPCCHVQEQQVHLHNRKVT